MDIKLIIFDMDGTLYEYEGASFSQSGAYQEVLKNATLFIAKKLGKTIIEAELVLNDIKERWGEQISLALEKEHGISREEYFNTVWDIKAEEYIKMNDELKPFLEKLSQKYQLVVLTDAPTVWVKNVLEALGVEKIFNGNIFDGTGDARKGSGVAFERVLKNFSFTPAEVFMIGDQENIDIQPAKNAGLVTVYLNKSGQKSDYADFSITSLFDLQYVLEVNHEEVLKRYFASRKIENKNIKVLAGSSEAKTFLCDGDIYKVGGEAVIKKELQAYTKFQTRMKSYATIFPQMEIVFNDLGSSILWIENLGAQSLEVKFKDEKSSLTQLKALNKKVLAKINLLFEETKSAVADDLFFDEIINAIKINLVKAGLSGRLTKEVETIVSHKKTVLEKYISSLAHKDLSVGNIIVSDDGDKVRFIDPRGAVPYLDESKASGNVAIDLIGYLISMQRKELEVKQKNKNIDYTDLVTEVEDQIKNYIDAGVFTEEFRKLCEVLWYSVYFACKCDYCTAPERLWLYNEMGRRLEKTLAQLSA